MADKRVPAYPANPGLASGDVLYVVDVSDPTDDATGTSTRATVGELATAVISVGGVATDAEVATAVSTHEADTTSVHGVADTSALYRSGGTDVAIADGGTGSSTAAGAATNLGLGTGDSPQFTAVNVGHASDTTVTRTGAGDIAVEGNVVYRAGGTDVPVADGGTGSSTAAGARTNLGLAVGTDVQAFDAELAALAGLTSAANKGIQFTGAGTAGTYDLTAAGKAVLDDADAAAQRVTLGVSTRVMQISVSDPNGAAITTGDGKAYVRVNSVLNGATLTAVAAHVTTVSSSGIPTVQIANVTQGWDTLTTKLTIDASEKDSSTAATAAVIDTSSSHNIVATGDELRVDIDVAGTGAKGLIVDLTFTF